jgi:hypothetical protein
MEKKIEEEIRYAKKNQFNKEQLKIIDRLLVLRYKDGFKAGQKQDREDVLKLIDKLKIIKDEFCQCGCSKKAHLPHQLDKNGGRCGICVHCDGYTWKGFEFIDLSELKSELSGSKDGK